MTFLNFYPERILGIHCTLLTYIFQVLNKACDITFAKWKDVYSLTDKELNSYDRILFTLSYNLGSTFTHYKYIGSLSKLFSVKEKCRIIYPDPISSLEHKKDSEYDIENFKKPFWNSLLQKISFEQIIKARDFLKYMYNEGKKIRRYLLFS